MLVGGASAVASRPRSGDASGPASTSGTDTSIGASRIGAMVSGIESACTGRSGTGTSELGVCVSTIVAGPSSWPGCASTTCTSSGSTSNAPPLSGVEGTPLSGTIPPSPPHAPEAGPMAIAPTVVVSPAVTFTPVTEPLAIGQLCASKMATATVAVPLLPAGR